MQCLTLPRVFGGALQAVLLSLQSDEPQSVFALVFAIVWFGAVSLTLNVLLLVRLGTAMSREQLALVLLGKGVPSHPL